MTQPTQTTSETRNVDALFRAPTWAAKLLTAAVMLGVLGVVSLATGGGIGVAVGNAIPAGVGVVLMMIFGLPAAIMQHYARRSLEAMYAQPAPPPVVASGEQTVLVVPRMLKVEGKPTNFGSDRITVNAPPGDVAKMLAWLREGGATSRTAVCKATGVSQTTWQRVMTALQDAGLVVNNGKSGYTLVESLDERLQKLDDRLR